MRAQSARSQSDATTRPARAKQTSTRSVSRHPSRLDPRRQSDPDPVVRNCNFQLCSKVTNPAIIRRGCRLLRARRSMRPASSTNPRSDSLMRTKLLMLLAAALLLSPRRRSRRSARPATLTGTVTDASGAVLPGVTVTVDGRIGHRRRRERPSRTRTASYRFPALPPGDVHGHCRALGVQDVLAGGPAAARADASRSIAKLEVGGLRRIGSRSPAAHRSST